MVERFKLRPVQHPMVDHILERPRCCLFAEMGLGKTTSVLYALTLLELLGESTLPCLVLGPKFVIETVWPSEVRDWPEFSHLQVSVITGTEVQRLNALRARSDVYTMGYHNLQWLVDTCKGFWPFKTVVADESEALKGFRLKQGGKRAGKLREYAFKSARWINLSGTPQTNGLHDLWGQLWFCDRGKRLGHSYSAFYARWFRQNQYTKRTEPVSEAAEREIPAAIADVALSVRTRDWLDLDKPIVTDVKITLPQRARQIYDDLERRMYTELLAKPLEVVTAAAKSQKCLQAAAGAIYPDAGSRAHEEIHAEKLDALEEIIAETRAPVLVATNFVSDQTRIAARFKFARKLDGPEAIEDWNKGRIKLLMAHPKSAGHGINLQHGGNVIVFFSLNWNLGEYLQTIERLGPTRQKQSGYDRPVFLYRILAQGTLDVSVAHRLEGKLGILDALMERLKR